MTSASLSSAAVGKRKREFPTSTQPRSWAEALQQYQQQKLTPPTLPHGPPSRHLPSSHPSHVSFNPFTSPSSPSPLTTPLLPPSPYNLLAPPPPTPPPPPPLSHWTSRGERGYDLLTCLPQYPDAPSILRLRDAEQRARDVRQASLKHSREQRDYDVVGHRYRYRGEGAEAKEAEEEGRRRADIVRTYWQGHHYNPVVGEFYNPEMEAAWRRRKAEVEATWGQERDQQRRERVTLDPATSGYNILYHTGQER